MAEAKVNDLQIPIDLSSLDPDGASEAYMRASVRHDSLDAAILAVMLDVSYCKKIQSQGLSYLYASEADLIAALRPAMVRNGITIRPVGYEPIEQSTHQSKSGTLQFKSRAAVTYKLSCVCKDGHVDSDLITVAGEAHDSSDKAASKSMTIALKYALRQTFLMITGDDPDKFEGQPLMRLIHQVDPETTRSFNRFIGAIDTAERIEKLEQFRKSYSDGTRKFGDFHLQQLEQAYEKQKTKLEKAKKPPEKK